MNDISFYTTLKIGWLNAWIPMLLIFIIQYSHSLFNKEVNKRATNMSFFNKKEKVNLKLSFVLYVLLIAATVFVPLKIGTNWFIVGMILYAISIIVCLVANYDYMKSPLDKTIQRGIYRISRNPMYLGVDLSILSIAIASASLWVLLILIAISIVTHPLILAEERYCEETYGEEYLQYKNKTPRYLFF